MSTAARKPQSLRPGDVVRIVSPASPVEPLKVQKCVDLLQNNGYRVEVGRHAFDRHGYLAGSDENRARDLQAAFDDPTVSAVLCSRGGYGSSRILRHLDLDRIAASQKLFIGYSDATALHLALNRRGLPTLYAPMALTLAFERETWVYQSFLFALRGENTIVKRAPRGKCLVAGEAAGIVTGGCLCLLTDSIGTPDALDCRGKIVVVEDVDEAPHRVDAMLTHLVLSGSLETASGIVVGEMTRTDEHADPEIGRLPWEEIVADRLRPLGLPTILGFPFGHMRNMLSLPLGIAARMNAVAGTLTYEESLCA